MAKIVVTAQVKGPVKWEESFRTHGDLFKRQKLTKPIDFGVSANQVAVCFETDDLGNLQAFCNHRKRLTRWMLTASCVTRLTSTS